MGASTSIPVPKRNPVPAGKTRICIAGYKISHHTGRARNLAALIAATHPDKYETWFYFAGSDDFYGFLKITFDSVPFPEHLKGHSSSPFVWLETGPNTIEPLGGREGFASWATKACAADTAIVQMASTVSVFDAFHNGSGAPQSTANVS